MARILDFNDTFESNTAPVAFPITITSGGYLYFGDSDTDGSWRIGIIGGNLTFQKRVSGDWETVENMEQA